MTFTCFWSRIEALGPNGADFLLPRGARLHYWISETDLLCIRSERRSNKKPFYITKFTAERNFGYLESGNLPNNFRRDNGWFCRVYEEVNRLVKCDSGDESISSPVIPSPARTPTRGAPSTTPRPDTTPVPPARPERR